MPISVILMKTDKLEIECPACGKMIDPHADKCPFCCAELRFHDINDLERVANGHPIEEKACVPQPEAKAPEPVRKEEPVEEKKGRFGKLFARGKK